MNQFSNTLKASNFLTAVITLVKPYMTGDNSGATTVDLQKNKYLCALIASTFTNFNSSATCTTELLNKYLCCAYHHLKSLDYAEQLGLSTDAIEKERTEKEQRDKHKVLALSNHLKDLAKTNIELYTVEADISHFYGDQPASFFDTLLDFIVAEGSNARPILERLAKANILSNCLVKNCEVLTALPDLVGDNGTQFSKHFKDQDFVSVTFMFADETIQGKKPTLQFVPWSLTLELTSTTRNVTIHNLDGSDFYRIML